MIGITKMATGQATVSQRLTYGGDKSTIPQKLVQAAEKPVPVMVWNTTSRCNLRCIHCYANAGSVSDELSTEEAKAFLDDLSEMKIPLMIFSGGEPIMRRDLCELASHITSRGIMCSLSTNGTLIDEDTAQKLKECGVSYVGVSIDGEAETNDKFRGVNGAFDKAFQGLLNSRNAGIMTGIRFTVTRYNVKDVPPIIDLLAENDIPRFCLYHLVPSGRAEFKDDITLKERRELIDWLFHKAVQLHDDGYKTEILTVDNPVDGIYTYLKLKETDEKLAEQALEFLKYRGGDSSGFRLSNVDMVGDVHPNQFWWDYTIGNVRNQKFSDMWLNPTDDLLIKLRDKTRYLGGRCGKCKFKEVCGGFRLRAMRYGDLWGNEPDCYLTDEEIGIA
ncbi:MAG: radical SAM protein [Archaeoglobaceae archaeon]